MEKTRVYEGLFIINPEKEETVDEVIGNIRTIISENAGNVIEEKPAVKKKLAYPMMKKEEGMYFEAKFNALPASIEKITRLCKINIDILRAFITLED